MAQIYENYSLYLPKGWHIRLKKSGFGQGNEEVEESNVERNSLVAALVIKEHQSAAQE